MNFRFLNNISFNWVEPYNPDASDGGWMIDPSTHSHKQWELIADQTNPQYYTTWGIHELCGLWIQNTKRLHPFVQTCMEPSGLYEQALVAETINDLDMYRFSLDGMITQVESELYQLVHSTPYPDTITLPEANTIVYSFQTAFS